MKKANLFVVGAPKCGTTALNNFLSQHPNIFMTTPKEVGYFCTDFIRESDVFHAKKKMFPIRTKKQYATLYKDWGKQLIGGEATTLYLYSKEAAQNIYDYNPEAKIIAVIREPSDFLHSLYNQFKMSNIDTDISFEKSLSLEEIRKKDISKVPEKIAFPSHMFYSEIVNFYEQLKRFYNLFPKKNIKVILFDEFKKNNRKVYNETINFLGLEPYDAEFKIINPRHKIIFRPLLNFASSPYVWKLPKKVLPKNIYSLTRETLYSFTKKPIESKKINLSTKNSLQKKYEPQVKNLSKLLERNLLQHWSYK